MEWNILLFIGLGLRIFYHTISTDYPFSFKTPEGKKNIGLTAFSGVLVFITWYLCFYLHFDDHIQDGWKLIGLWTLYVIIGWAIDSLFLFVMDLGEKVIKKWIGSKAGEIEPKQNG